MVNSTYQLVIINWYLFSLINYLLSLLGKLFTFFYSYYFNIEIQTNKHNSISYINGSNAISQRWNNKYMRLIGNDDGTLYIYIDGNQYRYGIGRRRRRRNVSCKLKNIFRNRNFQISINFAIAIQIKTRRNFISSKVISRSIVNSIQREFYWSRSKHTIIKAILTQR